MLCLAFAACHRSDGPTAPARPDVAGAAATRGNILFILTDDQRYDLMEYMPLTSAALDSETVRFERAYATTSLCCPSRASILTGLYAHNHKVFTNVAPNGGATRFDPSSTIATWLRAAGYRTMLAGKYLNGYNKLSPKVPPGWTIFGALLDVQYYNYLMAVNGKTVRYGSSPADYSTDQLANALIKSIEKVPASVPIFAYYAPVAPHQPATPAAQDIGSYAGLPPFRPESYDEADVADKPAWIRALPAIAPEKAASWDSMRQRQIESLQAVDRAVERLIDAFKRTNRWDNTMVVFMSDNGYAYGEHRLGDLKNCPYEECIRIPLWIRTPGITARTDTSLVANIDLAPTFADWAGVAVPSKTNGTSLVPLINEPGRAWRTSLLIEHWPIPPTPSPQGRGVRTSRFVYYEYKTGERELYDMWLDPFQLHNAIDHPEYAGDVTFLQSELRRLLAS